MNFIHFGYRMQIKDMYLQWCEENGIANKPNSFVAFLMSKGWLNEKRIIEELDRKDEPQTIRCPKCGRTDYVRSFVVDFKISNCSYKYKCINCNTYFDELQTDCAWK